MAGLIEKVKELLGLAPVPEGQPIRVEKDKPQWWEPKK